MWGASGTTWHAVSGVAVGTLGNHVWLSALRSALLYDVLPAAESLRTVLHVLLLLYKTQRAITFSKGPFVSSTVYVVLQGAP